jgi:hypothetical protein
MARYELLLEVRPSFAFGIPTIDHDVVPAGVDPMLIFDGNTGVQSISRPDGSDTSPREGERHRSSFHLNGVHFKGEDQYFVAALSENELTRRLK